jgi:hypothetical protein
MRAPCGMVEWYQKLPLGDFLLLTHNPELQSTARYVYLNDIVLSLISALETGPGLGCSDARFHGNLAS